MDNQKRSINGDKVAEIRKRLGMTQKQFGEAVGLTQSGVNNLEKGYTLQDGTKPNVRLDVFWRIAELGGVSMEWLMDAVEVSTTLTDLLTQVDRIKSAVYANEYLQLLMEYAEKLTPAEQQMMAMLCRRMAETTPTKTPEAVEAANLVDAMPEHRRVEALEKLRDLANKKEKAELRKQFDYLIQLIKDTTGEDMTQKVEELFRVWLTNGNGGKQTLTKDVAQESVDISP